MLRAFRFGIIAAILLAIIWYVATLPGQVSVEIGDYTATAATPIAIFAGLLAILVLSTLIVFLRGLMRTPQRLAARRELARRDTADTAGPAALSALAAGDPRAAIGHVRRARKAAPDAPLTLFAAGETARRTGDHDAADRDFTALTKHPHAGFLGWRGLLAHRLNGARDNAETLALAEAEASGAAHAYPNSVWLRGTRMQIAAAKERFDDAARLATTPRARAALAVMASRKAQSDRLAIDWARQAVRADPRLSEAWLVLYRAHERAGHIRRARRALRKGWAQAPHPDLAEAWLTGTTEPLDRAAAAEKLVEANLDSPETERLRARLAEAAGLEEEARRHAERLARMGAVPSTWICSDCGAAHAEWGHACRSCGAIGSLAWVTPKAETFLPDAAPVSSGRALEPAQGMPPGAARPDEPQPESGGASAA